MPTCNVQVSVNIRQSAVSLRAVPILPQGSVTVLRQPEVWRLRSTCKSYSYQIVSVSRGVKDPLFDMG
jgi:hypothetical protein